MKLNNTRAGGGSYPQPKSAGIPTSGRSHGGIQWCRIRRQLILVERKLAVGQPPSCQGPDVDADRKVMLSCLANRVALWRADLIVWRNVAANTSWRVLDGFWSLRMSCRTQTCGLAGWPRSGNVRSAPLSECQQTSLAEALNGA